MTPPGPFPPGEAVDVLVVDDDPVVRFGLTMMLRGAADLRVVAEAGDGAEALQLVDRHSPDVVLMDIRMPGMDGLTATETLRRRPRAPQVVVLTTFEPTSTSCVPCGRERPGSCSRTPRPTSWCSPSGTRHRGARCCRRR